MPVPGTCQAASQGAETPEGAEVDGAFVQPGPPQLPKVLGDPQQLGKGTCHTCLQKRTKANLSSCRPAGDRKQLEVLRKARSCLTHLTTFHDQIMETRGEQWMPLTSALARLSVLTPPIFLCLCCDVTVWEGGHVGGRGPAWVLGLQGGGCWVRCCLEASIKQCLTGSSWVLTCSESPPATQRRGSRAQAALGRDSSGTHPWALVISELSWGHLCAPAAVRASGAWSCENKIWTKSQGRAGIVPSAWRLLDPAWTSPPVWVPNTRAVLTSC